MSVSVVTLNEGRGHHLALLLEGLARGAPPAEVVVVEMGGDGAPLPALGFPARRTHQRTSGLPLAAARNAGPRVATGDTRVHLDVDCIPSAGLVTGPAAAVAGQDGLICCEIRYLPRGAVADGWTEARLDRLGARHPARTFPRSGVVPAPQPGLFWSLAFAVPAATDGRLGGFDEGFTDHGGGDTDRAFRAAKAGVPVLFAGGMRAWHQPHPACDPPLQHLSDIVADARGFEAHHGVWPMAGWLDAFAALGLLAHDRSDGLTVLRPPSEAEIAAGLVPPERPF